jgi:hypothetical protein
MDKVTRNSDFYDCEGYFKKNPFSSEERIYGNIQKQSQKIKVLNFYVSR